MSNAKSLKGKEYLDFVLDFLQGKKDSQSSKDKKFCYHEISQEESKKINESLTDSDVIYYFNVKDGMKTLVDSFEYSLEALPTI